MRLRRTKIQHQLAELRRAQALLAPGGESVLDAVREMLGQPALPTILKLLTLDGTVLTAVLAALPREAAVAYARAPALAHDVVTPLALFATLLINAGSRIDTALRTRADYAEIVAEARAMTAQAKRGG